MLLPQQHIFQAHKNNPQIWFHKALYAKYRGIIQLGVFCYCIWPSRPNAGATMWRTTVMLCLNYSSSLGLADYLLHQLNICQAHQRNLIYLVLRGWILLGYIIMLLGVFNCCSIATSSMKSNPSVSPDNQEETSGGSWRKNLSNCLGKDVELV